MRREKPLSPGEGEKFRHQMGELLGPLFLRRLDEMMKPSRSRSAAKRFAKAFLAALLPSLAVVQDWRSLALSAVTAFLMAAEKWLRWQS